MDDREPELRLTPSRANKALNPEQDSRVLLLAARLVIGLAAIAAIPFSAVMGFMAVPGTEDSELMGIFYFYAGVLPVVMALAAIGCLVPWRRLNLVAIPVALIGFLAMAAPFVYFAVVGATSG